MSETETIDEYVRRRLPEVYLECLTEKVGETAAEFIAALYPIADDPA